MSDLRTPLWRVGAELASAPTGRKADRRQAVVAGLAMCALLAWTGCTRGSTSSRPPIHLNPNMDDQPRYDAQEASSFFADGKAMREPVPGTVALGELADDPAFATGRTSAGEPVARLPVPVDGALLARGEERYGIYCGPCHAADGTGRSMLRERAGVATADLTQDRLVHETDGHLFDVITNGLGLMQGYGYPIEPRDRWAIVAWVRELQRQAGAEPDGAAPGAESDEATGTTVATTGPAPAGEEAP